MATSNLCSLQKETVMRPNVLLFYLMYDIISGDNGKFGEHFVNFVFCNVFR